MQFFFTVPLIVALLAASSALGAEAIEYAVIPFFVKGIGSAVGFTLVVFAISYSAGREYGIKIEEGEDVPVEFYRPAFIVVAMVLFGSCLFHMAIGLGLLPAARVTSVVLVNFMTWLVLVAATAALRGIRAGLPVTDLGEEVEEQA
ncbi:MAG: hypothetical protein AAB372_00440 [Patescibacteria group bacterium]